LKLANELTRTATGKTLYVLDEPTTGLHLSDVAQLIQVLQGLVDRGNSVLVIEHHMDLIQSCDWVIDLGPEGGNQGGKILAVGTPAMLAKLDTPTGIALREVMA
jgi:excinuclease ABC subunit A